MADHRHDGSPGQCPVPAPTTSPQVDPQAEDRGAPEAEGDLRHQLITSGFVTAGNQWPDVRELGTAV